MADQSPPPDWWTWQQPDEQPPSFPPSSSPPRPRRSVQPEHDFRHTILFTVAGTVVPGLGLIAAKRRIVGSVVLGLFATGVLAIGLYAVVDQQGLLAYALNPTALTRLSVALIMLAVIWVGIVVASHLSLRGRRVSSTQRAAGAILVGLLAFAVAAPLAVAANYSYVTATSVSTVFKSEKKSKSATRPTLAATQTTPRAAAAAEPLGGQAPAQPAAARRRRRPRSDRHPHGHDHPGQHRHRDRRHHDVQPAA